MRRVKIKTIVIPARARSKNYFGSATYSSNVGSSAGSSAPAVINYLPAYQNEDGTYTVDLEKVFFNGHVIAEKDVVCFGKEAGSESTTVIIDAAFSETSENTLQNKVITLKFKEVDQNIGNLSTLTTKDKSSLVAAINEAFQNAGMSMEALWEALGAESNEQINAMHISVALDDYAKKQKQWITEQNFLTWLLLGGDSNEQINKTHLNDALSDYATQKWVTDKGFLNLAEAKKSFYTESEIDDKLKGLHTHTNLQVLEKITEDSYKSWNLVVENWSKAFYFDKEGSIRVKLNLVGEKDVSSYGKGSSSSGGIITIIDNLTSFSTDAALSANMGRYLKQLIDEKTVDVDLTEYAKKDEIPTDNIQIGNSRGYITSSDLNGYATQDWVNGKGFLTSHQSLANYAKKSEAWLITDFSISDYAKKSEAWLTSDFSISDYATHTWVNQQGFLTSHQSLTNYYTKSQVDTELAKKSDTGHTHSQYLTSHQSLSHLAKKDGSNADGTWNASAKSIEDAGDKRKLTFNYSNNDNILTSWIACWNGNELRAVSKDKFWTVDDFSSTSVSHWNTAYDNSHTHSNKSALDKLYMSGSILHSSSAFVSDKEVTCYSDIRLKEDIQPLKNRGMIQPVTYYKDGKKCIGFIAQDIQKLYPELVIEDDSKDKFLSLNYAQYTAVLQSQIIELKKEIEQLKKERKEEDYDIAK